MPNNNAPTDPLLHDMEPVLEPDEALDDAERGQDDTAGPSGDPLSDAAMRDSNEPLTGTWTDHSEEDPA